ncbi:MAG TPA: protein kinase, partial [Pyrinomonadaceae bacterium]
MGRIYEADDLRLNKKIAIKQAFIESETMYRAFEREAKFLARLEHPSLPRVTNLFFENRSWFFALDYIDGKDLRDELKERDTPFSIQEVKDWANQLFEVLEYLHNQPNPII